MPTSRDLHALRPTWCPGCGDYAVLASLERALAEMEMPPERVVVVAGIGCSGKLAQYVRSYGFQALHGRALPLATGVKLANPDLTVVAAGGDGDGYAIGVGHLIHAARRNVDLAYFVMDNNLYSLTTGQASPTTPPGMVTRTTPQGMAEAPVRPLSLAVVAGATFVAQAFSGDPSQMVRLFREAISHRGFALVNCFSPCVTFNRARDYDWFRRHLHRLEEDPDHDPADRAGVLAMLARRQELVTGLVYRESRPTLDETLSARHGGPAALEIDHAGPALSGLLRLLPDRVRSNRTDPAVPDPAAAQPAEPDPAAPQRAAWQPGAPPPGIPQGRPERR